MNRARALVERLNGTVRQKNKVMRGLDHEDSAQTMLDRMRIYYNFIRPTPAKEKILQKFFP